MNLIIGYFLAVLVGISLGLIGSGGSILSVPIFVYIMGVEPVLATAYSLFTVGTTALVGGFNKLKKGEVDLVRVFYFGIPAVLAVFFTRKIIIPAIPEIILIGSFEIKKNMLIMCVFAIVMLIASIKMIVPSKVAPNTIDSQKINYIKIAIPAVLIGLLAGFVGAGGGFLIIPVLVFIEKLPMKKAVGTSLFIIALQSLLGFLGDFQNNISIDWKTLLIFTTCSVAGIFIGILLSKKIAGEKLKTAFGWFVLLMGIYIIIKEVFIR